MNENEKPDQWSGFFVGENSINLFKIFPNSLVGNRFERGSMKEEMKANDNFDKVSHRFYGI